MKSKPKHNRDPNMVRINVILTEAERTVFDKWCRYGGLPRMSMTSRLRDLLNADAAGKIDLPRDRRPRKKPTLKKGERPGTPGK